MRKLIHVFLVVSMLAVLTGIAVKTASAHTGHVITIDDLAAPEGSGGGTGDFLVSAHVTPAPQVGEEVSVSFGTSSAGGTATPTPPGDTNVVFPEDYQQTDGTVTFGALQTTQTISVPVLRDNADEANETFFINLFGATSDCIAPGPCTTSASIGDPKATVTITDDDVAPILSVNNVTHNEGNADTTAYAFTVSKTGGSDAPVTVDYAAANDTAVSPSDYAATSGTLTFPASSPIGAETQTVTVLVNGDTLFEPTETFFLNLSNPTNATISDGQGLGTITNDDAVPPPSMTIADATAAEGNPLGFVVTLSAPPGVGQTATVDWTTQATGGPNDATAGSDYTNASGSLTYTAGETEHTITVPTNEDGVHEADETFNVVLSKPETHGTGGYTYNIADDTAVGTITNDDSAPTLAIDNVTVTEGASGVDSVATFTVTKTGASAGPVTVDYATADGTATAVVDYTATNGSLSFATDETTKEIAVTVKGDNIDEANETFLVNLTNPSGATLADDQGVGTITDDDAVATTLSVNDITVAEGNSGTTPGTFTVTKAGATGQTVTVQYHAANGSAKINEDFLGEDGTLTFLPGEMSKTVVVDVVGDVLDEIDETFRLDLSNATNATILDPQGIATITDNDAAPTIHIANDRVGEVAGKACALLVTLSAPSGREITVHYRPENVTAGTRDYVFKTGDVVFPAGDDDQQIKIFVKGDSRREGTERFYVRLSDIRPEGAATFLDSTGTCAILDND